MYEDENEDEAVPCDQCDFACSNIQEGRSHRETRHPHETKDNNCDKRDSIKGSNNNQQSHKEYDESYMPMKGTDGKIMFECKLCKSSFSSQKAVKQHGRMKHGAQHGYPCLDSDSFYYID